MSFCTCFLHEFFHKRNIEMQNKLNYILAGHKIKFIGDWGVSTPSANLFEILVKGSISVGEKIPILRIRHLDNNFRAFSYIVLLENSAFVFPYFCSPDSGEGGSVYKKVEQIIKNGVRKNNKGRKVNRKINSMPFYRLKEYIKYKALERGILVIEVPEFNTSKQCSKCGSMNTERPSQGVFICKDCGYQINADVNGAKNILKRAQGYMLWVGAAVTQPEGERSFVLHTPQPP